MKTRLFMSLVVTGLFLTSCGGGSLKYSGIYDVNDKWSSSKTDLGTGSLDYELIIIPDGADGVILMNVNKTLNRVRAKVKGDEIVIEKQTLQSVSGKTYTVSGKTGKLVDNKLLLTFVYSDVDHANSIGEITCDITGTKEKMEPSKM